jgi:hypothetical protein
VELGFGLHLHKKDQVLLQAIQNSLQGIGNITNNGEKAVQLQVSSIKDLRILINHFDKYPLITQKLADYLLFKQAFNLVSCKEHLTTDGLYKLVSIKSSINKGLSAELAQAFSAQQVKPILRPDINKEIYILNPYWLGGFISAEGCFFIHIERVAKNVAKSNSITERVRLRFQISQHFRDAALLKSFIEYFDCGNYYLRPNQNVGDFVVTKFSDIHEKILPFIEKYPIYGVKALDYRDICKLVELMKNKEHLTSLGLDEIKKIKEGMNRNRNE